MEGLPFRGLPAQMLCWLKIVIIAFVGCVRSEFLCWYCANSLDGLNYLVRREIIHQDYVFYPLDALHAYCDQPSTASFWGVQHCNSEASCLYFNVVAADKNFTIRGCSEFLTKPSEHGHSQFHLLPPAISEHANRECHLLPTRFSDAKFTLCTCTESLCNAPVSVEETTVEPSTSTTDVEDVIEEIITREPDTDEEPDERTPVGYEDRKVVLEESSVSGERQESGKDADEVAEISSTTLVPQAGSGSNEDGSGDFTTSDNVAHYRRQKGDRFHLVRVVENDTNDASSEHLGLLQENTSAASRFCFRHIFVVLLSGLQLMVFRLAM